ncbi:MAG: LytTR family transcriptional regulator [Bacteroidales bacterium]|nr:LytTR family transcriptional regulator [Bacteroidales bacterium]
MDKKNAGDKALFVKTGSAIKRVLGSEILYIQCDGNVSHLYLLDGTELICVRLLKLFEEDLSGAGFIRVNHNVLVNLGEIVEIRYINARKRQVVLTGGVVLDVSYRKWKPVKDALLGRK